MKRALLLLGIVSAIVSGCAGPVAPSPTIPPSPSPSGAPMSEAELKFALLDRFGELWYCDPDEYPVSRGDESEQAAFHFPEIVANDELLQTIVDWIELERVGEFTAEQQLHIYRAWKLLNAIVLTDAGDGRYRFEVLTKSASAPGGGLRTAGVIDPFGGIEVEQQVASGEPACPICLAQGTRIATPGGEVRVEDLSIGDLVWTTDAFGRRIVGHIVASGRATAPASHRVVHLVLADGREVWVSPRHPLADGRAVGMLRPGDLVNGSRVVSADRVAYASGATFDILASGSAGAYWANGILMGSTLRD